MIGFSIDDFINKFSPIQPNHIKIDVDGIEDKIIKGAKNIIKNKDLKSILIELNENQKETKEVIDIIESAGLRLTQKEQAPMFNKGKFSSVFNYIFIRK